MDSLPPWPVVQSMLLAVVLPGFAAGAVVLAGCGLVVRSETGWRIGGALAFVAGLTAGNFTRALWPWWSLEPGWPSLFPAVVTCVCGSAALAWASSRWSPRWRRVAHCVLAAACAWWLSPAGPVWSRFGIFVLLLAGAALDWSRLHSQRSPVIRHAVLFLGVPWGIAAATVLIYAHSARFCDMAVLQTVTLAGMGLVVVLRKLEAAVIGTGAALFIPALVLGGATSTYSDVPLASFLLIAMVPCLLWGLCWPGVQRWPDRKVGMAAIVAVLVPCAAAVALAVRAESLAFNE